MNYLIERIMQLSQGSMSLLFCLTPLLAMTFLTAILTLFGFRVEENDKEYESYENACFKIMIVLCVLFFFPGGFILRTVQSTYNGSKLSLAETEVKIRSEMSYRLGKESQPNDPVFTYMSDRDLISELEKLRENKREINLALENQSGKIFLKASGSLKGKQSKIEQAMENKERIQLDEFLKTATIEEKEAYVEVLKQRKEQVDNLLERIKKEAE